jgi:transcriptional regulator with XRE-family HTH domain
MSARHLSPSAVKVLFWLCLTMRKGDRKSWWSQAEIAKKCGMSRTTVRRAESELMESGHIEHVSKEGRAFGVYVRDPSPETLKRSLGDQNMASTDSGHAQNLVTHAQNLVTPCTESGHEPKQNQSNKPKQERPREEDSPSFERVNGSSTPPRRPATETCPACGSVVSLLYSLPYGVSGPHVCSECLSRYEQTGSVTA